MNGYFPLGGQVVVVSGGGRRLGARVSFGLAKLGAIVVPFSRGAPDPSLYWDGWTDVHPETCDVTDPGAVFRLRDSVHRDFGEVCAVVHMADTFASGNDLDSAMAVAVTGAHNLTEAFRGRMVRGGVFVHVVDSFARRPQPGWLAHSAAKGALERYSHALAVQLAPTLRSVALLLGPVLPPENVSWEAKARLAGETLIGEWGDPGHVTEALAFLVRCGYVTGTTLTVDGGQTLKSFG